MLLTLAGGAPFTPLSLPNLAAWYDASAASTLWQDSARTTPAVADGDPVGAWDDRSGNARHVTQATAGARPTLKLAIQSGKPVVRLDGVDDRVSRAADAGFTVNGGKTIAGVVRYAGTGGEQCWVDRAFGYAVTATAAGAVKVYLVGVAGSPFTTAVTLTGAHALVVVWDGTDLTVYKDADPPAVTAAAGTQSLADDVWAVGATGSGTLPWAGDVAETLFYATALAAGPAGRLRDYLRARWGTP